MSCVSILALDLATATGWAFDSGDDSPIAHGVKNLPKTGEEIGPFAAAFRDWLTDMIERLRPGELVFEMPILAKLTNPTTVRKLNGLCVITEMVVFDFLQRDVKIVLREANLLDIRNYFIGLAKAPKSVPKKKRSQWLKDKIVAKCADLGFKEITEDEADAIALVYLRRAQIDPRKSVEFTPLFGKAAA